MNTPAPSGDIPGDTDLLQLCVEVELEYTDEDAVLTERYSVAGRPTDAADLADALSALTRKHPERPDNERVSVAVDGEIVTHTHYRALDEAGRLGPLYLLMSSALQHVIARDPEVGQEMLASLRKEAAPQ